MATKKAKAAKAPKAGRVDDRERVMLSLKPEEYVALNRAAKFQPLAGWVKCLVLEKLQQEGLL